MKKLKQTRATAHLVRYRFKILESSLEVTMKTMEKGFVKVFLEREAEGVTHGERKVVTVMR